MVQPNYVPIELKKGAFNCPICNTFAKQNWSQFYLNKLGSSFTDPRLGMEKLDISHCEHCNQHTLWVNDIMVYPSTSTAPLPLDDMPQDVKNDFNEARDIFDKSPKAAAALLRLSLQKLCIHLGGEGKNLNDDIANILKENKLPPIIQKMLDTVRIIGNNAVHPGEIDVNDTPQIVISLFKILNILVEKLVIEPKEFSELYDSMVPDTAKPAIKKRDSK